MITKYDYAVIGAGPAGYVSAIKAAEKGLKTVVIEKGEDRLGGVCLNEGCIPAKSLFNSAKIFELLVREADLLKIKDVKADTASFAEKARKSSEILRKGVAFLFKKHGITLIVGDAKFEKKDVIRVASPSGGTRDVEASKILIATGSSPRGLKELPFDGKRVLSSSDIIFSKDVPKNILIIGGGAIGVEFAVYLSTVGSDVSVLEKEERLIPSFDQEISRTIETELKKKGIKIFTSAFLKRAEVKEDGIDVDIERDGKTESVKYEKVLVSVGRKPNTTGLGLEEIGIKTDKDGFIEVSADVETNIKNIFAAGDVTRSPMLAHLASSEGRAAAIRASGVRSEKIDLSSVPNVVYTEPQAAGIGQTETEAISSGKEILVGKHFFRANGKAVLSSQPEGFIKIIVDKKTRKFLGVYIVGAEAGELIHEFVLAKRMGLTADDVAGTIHAHPTLSEIAGDVCRSV
ncbi:MAG: dihydrolipoyl dehydrogenase [Candidatus Omnitrophota bacterium]